MGYFSHCLARERARARVVGRAVLFAKITVLAEKLLGIILLLIGKSDRSTCAEKASPCCRVNRGQF